MRLHRLFAGEFLQFGQIWHYVRELQSNDSPGISAHWTTSFWCIFRFYTGLGFNAWKEMLSLALSWCHRSFNEKAQSVKSCFHWSHDKLRPAASPQVSSSLLTRHLTFDFTTTMILTVVVLPSMFNTWRLQESMTSACCGLCCTCVFHVERLRLVTWKNNTLTSCAACCLNTCVPRTPKHAETTSGFYNPCCLEHESPYAWQTAGLCSPFSFGPITTSITRSCQDSKLNLY